VWKIKNGGNGWSHPVHVHFEEGVILSRDGKAPPEWEKWARKDVYRIGPDKDSSEEVEMAIRFREFAGTYMEHCHNTQHEDSSMLLRWDIEHPGQFQVMPTPLPGWDGVQYVNSAALPTFRKADGDGGGNEDPATNHRGGERQCRHQCRQADRAQRAGQRHRPGRQPAADGQRPGPADSGMGTVSSNGTQVTYTPPATVASRSPPASPTWRVMPKAWSRWPRPR
jgi:hypothetical protein